MLRVLAGGSGGEVANAVLTGVDPLLGKLNAANPLAALVAPVLAPVAREPKRQREAATARVAAVLQRASVRPRPRSAPRRRSSAGTGPPLPPARWT
ncbi:hypothetical protein [Frigoriglobus tundricola]|uniref:hypothetical protein n=1 Tax=Frigoriglobus tundricola TaxID=2774151 RepID=UPI00148EB0C0|nr:hypothetical protein [Frigoriglobus tundricola]